METVTFHNLVILDEKEREVVFVLSAISGLFPPGSAISDLNCKRYPILFIPLQNNMSSRAVRTAILQEYEKWYEFSVN